MARMRVLLLGGTRFLGRAIAEAALRRGHALTLFHRGRSHPEIFPEVEHVIGDRENDLHRLDGRSFDAVIDPSAFEVFTVRKSARIDAGVYVFVSTISVYSDMARMDEDGPTHTIEDAENLA